MRRVTHFLVFLVFFLIILILFKLLFLNKFKVILEKKNAKV
jgi:hypothetical protein